MPNCRKTLVQSRKFLSYFFVFSMQISYTICTVIILCVCPVLDYNIHGGLAIFFNLKRALVMFTSKMKEMCYTIYSMMRIDVDFTPNL
jgi:hypothetical protein